VGGRVPRRRRVRTGRGEQPRRLSRRRCLAQLAGHRRRAAGHRAVAGRPPRPGPGHAHAAARRGDRLGAAPRRDGRRHGTPDRQRQPLPGAALRNRARRPAGRGPAGLGGHGRRPRHGAAHPPRRLRRPVPLLDGLVLPGPGRRGHRRRGPRPAGCRLGPVRRPRAGRPLRVRPSLGHRSRDLRARARARRRGTAGGRHRAGRRDAAPAPRRRFVLDGAGVRRRRPLAGRADDVDGGRRRPGRRCAVGSDPRRRAVRRPRLAAARRPGR
jgi:hypothetical protein